MEFILNTLYTVQWKFTGDSGDLITAYAKAQWVESFICDGVNVLVFERLDKKRDDGSTIFYYFDDADLQKHIMQSVELTSYSI